MSNMSQPSLDTLAEAEAPGQGAALDVAQAEDDMAEGERAVNAATYDR